MKGRMRRPDEDRAGVRRSERWTMLEIGFAKVEAMLTLLLVLAAPRTLAAPGTVVTLRDSVELAGSEVTLAAVARVDSSDGDLAARLSGLVLAKAPMAGRTLELGRMRILEVLAKEGLDKDLRLEGPDL